MLFLISLKYIEERKIFKYMMINCIGVLFHTSSLLYLPLYFVLHKRWSRKIILFLFIIGNVVFLLQLEWCKVILTNIGTLFPGRLGLMIKLYFASDFYGKAYGITIGYLERFFSFIILFYFYEKIFKINKNNLLYMNIFFIYIFIFLYFSEIMIILERVTLLFIFPYWILYPQIYSLIKNRNKQIFLFILLFYGVLKMGVGNRNIFSLYDNILFDHLPHQERVIIQEHHRKYIFE